MQVLAFAVREARRDGGEFDIFVPLGDTTNFADGQRPMAGWSEGTVIEVNGGRAGVRVVRGSGRVVD